MTRPASRPVPRLDLRTEFQQGVVTVHVGGSLEYGVTDSLVAAVTEQLDLAARTGGHAVHRLDLELGELTFVDSMGLASLLMARRVTDARGVTLRLNRRPDCLDRLLRVTCTFDHLTAATAPGNASAPDRAAGGSGTPDLRGE
ncbi:STAS domain-containing protein [Streptomyces sp. NPDC050439]|uniref:STAS domain-containing protein n=1 Tax=unclassified Streptomyces TaxID=2593676 RepID=UPI00342411BB